MASTSQPEDKDGAATGGPARVGGDGADLVAQIRHLAAHDPVEVQQVVADVLAALDRATGGTLRKRLPDAAERGHPTEREPATERGHVTERGQGDPS